ncbi:MAG: trehalose-6-phosphate synthase [Actinomycetota bacterium]|nr:trehalose-6-phosphate synthase [Actinomycetota bacterium]
MARSRRKNSFVIVANRLPVDHTAGADGTEGWRTSPGGLVTAMAPVMAERGGSWIGWSGVTDAHFEPFEKNGMRLIPVDLSGTELIEYYEGFSNATLWPLYHDVTAPPVFDRHWWDSYVIVNQRFANAAVSEAAREALVWVQDYQLQLVPAMIRTLRPDLRIGFFNHIPFPPFELYARLPWRRQIIEGLLGADLLGFQRRDDASNFLRAVRRVTGATTRGSVVELGGGGPKANGAAANGAGADGPASDARTAGARPGPARQLRAGSFPISIDSTSLEELAKRPDVVARAEQIRAELGYPDVVLLGVDRLDYTKGIRHRLLAYAELLDEGAIDPADVVLVQVASPSRGRVDEYQRLRDDVELVVGRINGEHATVGHPAVHYLHQSFPREEMAALYLVADVMLVTPLRDGMNLVAKEYVACRHDERGALVLSEFTGAADELRQAFIINPYDIDGLKDTIGRAVRVSPTESGRRMRALRKRVFEDDVSHWAETFLGAIDLVRAPA